MRAAASVAPPHRSVQVTIMCKAASWHWNGGTKAFACGSLGEMPFPPTSRLKARTLVPGERQLLISQIRTAMSSHISATIASSLTSIYVDNMRAECIRRADVGTSRVIMARSDVFLTYRFDVGPSTCSDFVANNPNSFTDAFWEFGAFQIYQAS